MSFAQQIKSEILELEKMRLKARKPMRIFAAKIKLSETKTWKLLNLIEPICLSDVEKLESNRLIGSQKMDVSEFLAWTNSTEINFQNGVSNAV